MFDLFKKNTAKVDIAFLKAIVLKLPSKYDYLLEQVTNDFILGKELNPLGGRKTYSLKLDVELEKKYFNSNFPNLLTLKDISIFNKKKNRFDKVELFIVKGVLSGFKGDFKYNHIDLEKIDVSKLYGINFFDSENENFLRILGNLEDSIATQLDLDSSIIIEIEDQELFTIKNLGDGNYVAINSDAAIFGLIHDPYIVEKIFKHKDEFFKALTSGEFVFENYYRQKLESGENGVQSR